MCSHWFDKNIKNFFTDKTYTQRRITIMRRIGIIGAMEVEVEKLKERMQDVEITRKASMEFYAGPLEGKNVVVVRSGIGKVNAAVCTQILIDDFDAEVVINTGIAGSLNADINIGDLVISTDLGSALIYFMTYLIMLYVATRQPLYAVAGVGAGCGAAVIGYHIFSHIKVRVAAWQDPFATYSNGGYQIAQSLFAIGSGGWFGTGLFKGQPDTIPVAETDLIFSAITEEIGMIFSLCLILICVSCYVMFLNIAMELRNQFYKLVALGLGTCYIFQVFLQIGGVTKFIPLTGVTLPFVSYGGSSLLSTMIMFGIIQGLYIVREDEEAEREEKRRKKLQHEKNAKRRERELKDGSGRKTKKKSTTSDKPRFEEVPRQRTPKKARSHNQQRVR